MASELRTSEAGLKLIMAYEGFRSHSKQLPNGRWVIGYGHMKAARPGLKVSQHEAAAILREYDLPPLENALRELLLVPINQNEFDALVSFAFNIGVDQFENSDVLAHLNAGDRLKAAQAMESWRKAHVGGRDMVVDPLVRRRADEKALFLKTVGVVPLAATSRFRPITDTASDMLPSRPSSVRIAESSDTRPQAAARPRPDETAPEAAARTVRERLTRILGEESAPDDSQDEAPETPAPEKPVSQEASVEEIRRAISALVSDDDEDEQRAVTGDIELDEIVLDDRSDKTHAADEHLFDVETGSLSVREGTVLKKDGKVYIDDVSPVEIPPADPTLHRGHNGDSAGPMEVFLFGLVALLGAALFTYGGAMLFGWFGIETETASDITGFLPPFLMLSGGLLFAIMSYYCVRALIDRD